MSDLTDRELLEGAARAAGIKLHRWMGEVQNRYLLDPDFESGLAVTWNPLTDDGDALRLAVNLRIQIKFMDGFKQVYCYRSEDAAHMHGIVGYGAGADKDPTSENVRRAVVRAAYAIGSTRP
jgi:hypothetical protein